ncbi:MAG: hypothetical protein DWQ44_06480 [Bacteroidetes bacterium]|nr:MAG: hypothetical protein DWQ33_02950 [Bacteroidota bacterium]REK00943.1 MAG: hypothetical protein DWQ39_10245 [Bacteroidota bacterium]REK34546.1 MAG: hypothetical protein DWQ44_06480 [Bacteroidota bacterium]REK51805.1 MAG: hypothetical protein DWQ48_00080 [Bacteroidota bacterium]
MIQFEKDYLASVFNKVMQDISMWIPSALGIILILFIGWIIAWLFRWLVSFLLKKAGLDLLTEKSGAQKVLHSWGIKKPLSKLAGRLFYWVVLILFILVAVESMGLNIVAGLFKTVIGYVPHIIGALLIILAGGFLANIIGDTVAAMGEKSGVVRKSILGQAVKYVLIIFTIIIAMQELGVETLLLSSVVIVLVAGLAIALSIGFGLGSRELARNIMAGFHARESFAPGIRLKVGTHEGVLIRIGTYKFILDTGNASISLPNHLLTEHEVLIMNHGQK